MANSAFTPSTFGQGIVVPGVSPGQVSANGLPGRTDGAAIAAGYVGQKLTYTVNFSPPTSGVYESDGPLNVPAGSWMLHFQGDTNQDILAYWDRLTVGISTDSNSTTFSDEAYNNKFVTHNYTASVPTNNFGATASITVFVNLASPTNYYIKNRQSMVSGSPRVCRGTLTAIRIA